MTIVITTLASLAILLALFWLLFGRPAAEPASSIDALEIEKLLPLHCRHFAQIVQILGEEDHQFISKRAPRHVERQWRAERRRILRQYLDGLGQDFGQLGRLARLIAALSPEVRKTQEWEWMWLGVQFRLLYRMVGLRIAFGSFAPNELARLAEMVAGVAGELKTRMSLIAAPLPSRLGMNVSD